MAARLFSVLTSIISIVLAYWLGRYLFDDPAAYFSAFFLSISAFAVRYAQEARSYSLVIALGLLSSLFLLKLEKENTARNTLGFTLANAAGIYTHYFYIFIAGSQFFYFTLSQRKNSQRLNRFYLAFLSSLAFLLPWVIAVIKRGYNFHLAEWIFGYPGLGVKFYSLITGGARYFYIFNSQIAVVSLSWLAAWALMIYMAGVTFGEAYQKYRKQLIFCLVMFLGPLLGMFFIDLIQNGALLKQERFWGIPFIGFIPLFGYFLSRLFLRNKVLAYIALAGMLVSSLFVCKIQFGPAPRSLCLWINKEAKGSRAGVIIYNIRSAVLTQAYYLDDHVYMLAVSGPKQLQSALRIAYRSLDKVFLVRYYHPTDNALMDQYFMAIRDIGPGFKLKASLKRDNISVTEYNSRK